MNEYDKDPKLAIDKPQLLKQVKQAGGIDLNEQPANSLQTINVDKLQVLVQEDLNKSEPVRERREVIDVDVAGQRVAESNRKQIKIN